MFNRHIRQEKIVDYVLGHLSSKEHFKVNTHLAKCEQCSRERDYWQKHFHVESIPVPSIQLEHNILLNIQQKRKRNYPKIAYLAISCCLLLLFTIGIWHFAKTRTTSQPDITQNTVLQEDVFVQLPVSELTSFQQIKLQLPSDNARSNQGHDLDPVAIQALFDNISQPPNEILQISSQIYLQTTSGHQTVQQLWVNDDIHEPIIFVNQHALCSYDPQQKKLICMPFEFDPQTNQLILDQNQMMRLKHR